MDKLKDSIKSLQAPAPSNLEKVRVHLARPIAAASKIAGTLDRDTGCITVVVGRGEEVEFSIHSPIVMYVVKVK